VIVSRIVLGRGFIIEWGGGGSPGEENEPNLFEFYQSIFFGEIIFSMHETSADNRSSRT